MENKTQQTSGTDFVKELESKRIMSDGTKRNEVIALIADRGIELKAKTKEFLDNYTYRKGTTIQANTDTITIHTEDGAWSDEVCVKADGSFSYCGGINCIW